MPLPHPADGPPPRSGEDFGGKAVGGYVRWRARFGCVWESGFAIFSNQSAEFDNRGGASGFCLRLLPVRVRRLARPAG